MCLINTAWVWFDDIRLTVQINTSKQPAAIIRFLFSYCSNLIGGQKYDIWHHLFQAHPLQTSEGAQKDSDINILVK